jgi:hypothetical protein
MKKRELQTIYKNEFDYYGESDEEEQNANLIDVALPSRWLNQMF